MNAGIDAYLEAAQRAAPILAKHRQESEARRSLHPESARALRETGLSRLLTPKEFGGHEAPLRAQVMTCAETARSCPATSWVQMVCGAHSYVLGSFPLECQREVFEANPGTLIAGTLSSQGAGRRTQGGWRVSGRWQFCSGVDHSDWLLIGASQQKDQQAGPRNIHFVIPTGEARVEDTWFTLGMRGTGSKDITLEEIFVPEHRVMPTGDLFAGQSPWAATHPTGLYMHPVLPALATQLAGCALGITREMLARFVERNKIRKDVYDGSAKAQKASLQRRIAEASAEISSAEAMILKNCDHFDALNQARRPADIDARAQLRWQACYAVELCRRAGERLFAGAGAHATYDHSPIQANFRDLSTITKHAAVDFDGAAEIVGRLALGLDAGSFLL